MTDPLVRATATNLPWVIDEKKIQRDLKVTMVRLVNDLEATAYALTEISPGDSVTLSAVKKDVDGNKAN